MQATLLAEDGTTLCRRYLKLSERLSSGSEFQFPNYLVEVGEPRKRHDGINPSWNLNSLYSIFGKF